MRKNEYVPNKEVHMTSIANGSVSIQTSQGLCPHELYYRVKELQAFPHEKKYMATRECEHFRPLYASVHFFS
jgi:hypothetical protein